MSRIYADDTSPPIPELPRHGYESKLSIVSSPNESLMRLSVVIECAFSFRLDQNPMCDIVSPYFDSRIATT